MTPARPSRDSLGQACRGAPWRAGLGGVFLGALLLRLAYAAHAPDSRLVSGDGYEEVAQSLAAGTGFARADGRNFWGEEAPDKRGATFFTAPLYPFVLAPFYRFGLGLRPVLALQALLDAIAVVILASLARRLFGTGPGILVGLLGVLSPFMIYHAGSILTEAVATFLIVLALALFQTCLAKGRWTEALALGAVVGLGVMARPTVQVLALAFTLVWLCRLARGSRRQVALLCAFWLALIAVLLPWMIRNYRGLGVFYPTTTAAPYSVFKGWGPWQLDAYRARTRAQLRAAWNGFLDREKRIYAANRDRPYWDRAMAFQREGIRFVRTQPAQALEIWLHRLLHYASPGVSPLHYPRSLVVVSWTWESLLFLLAGAGMWRVRREQPHLVAAALLVVAGSLLLHSLAHMELRYRVPFAEPVAILFAGAALTPARRIPAGAPDVPGEPR